MTLRIVPLTLKQANDLVAALHRHHQPVVGHRFSIGVKDGHDILRGAPDVARLKMLGEHHRDDLVLRATADSGGIFGAAEDRVSAEEGRG